MPAPAPTAAISASSVLTIVRVSRRLARAASQACSSSGRPASGARFLRGMPFEPPRAGITPRISIDQY
jgi:hypothetical protein